MHAAYYCTTCYPRMPISKVWTYRSLYFCFCLFVFCVCTVTDFSAEDQASGIKFCTVIHPRPRLGISHFRKLCFSRRSPEAQNLTNRSVAASIADRRQSPPLSASARGTPSACVDIRPSRKTDVLVKSSTSAATVTNTKQCLIIITSPPPPGRGAKCCDQCFCMSVHSYISKTGPHFTIFSVRYLWPWIGHHLTTTQYVVCTSGFVDYRPTCHPSRGRMYSSATVITHIGIVRRASIAARGATARRGEASAVPCYVLK